MFKPLSLAFDEVADLVEGALKTETFTSATFKAITTYLAIVVYVTDLCEGLKLIKKPPSLCFSSFGSCRYRLIYVIT